MNDAERMPRKTVLLITKNDFREQRDGGSKRVAAVVASLEGQGLDVNWVGVRPFVASDPTVAPRFDWATISAVLRVFWASVRSMSLSTLKWFSPRAIAYVVASQRQHRADYPPLVIEFSQLVMYRHACRVPLALDMHNIESELLENHARSATGRIGRALASYESARMRAIEAKIARQFAVVGVVSDHDQRLLDELASDSATTADIVVAPNGVSEDNFQVDDARTNTVVFVAHLGWRPNIDAAVWLGSQVWPHVRRIAPDLILQLVGRSPTSAVRALESSDVEVHADVPSTVPFVSRARVATAPLLSAGGTRIKILEALASGTPVVATKLGALGLEAIDPTILCVVDAPDAFALAIVAAARGESDRGSIQRTVDGYRWSSTLEPFAERVSALGIRVENSL